ncbi:MAG: hypothetical protein ACOCZS_04670 [Verrucomicrobiota bacterium]
MDWLVGDTIEHWRNEGLPTINRYKLYNYFGMDKYYQFRLHHETKECPRTESHGAGILQNAEEYD